MSGMVASSCPYCGCQTQYTELTIPGLRPMRVPMPCQCARAQHDLIRDEVELELNKSMAAFSKVWDRADIPVWFRDVEPDPTYNEAIDSGRAVYLTGRNGRGKTYTACAIAKSWLMTHTVTKNGMTYCERSLRFLTSQQMESLLKSSWKKWDVSEEDLFQRWIGVDLLILDDVGKGITDERLAENFFRLLSDRWSDRRPMIITSQYKTPDLARRLCADDNTLDAMLSRLRGWCVGRVLDGPDRRLEMAS